MFGYVTVLRTITSGRATSSMEFDHYEEVSNSIAKQVVMGKFKKPHNGMTQAREPPTFDTS